MLGPNAQGEWRAATVKLRLVNKQYALIAGHPGRGDSSAESPLGTTSEWRVIFPQLAVGTPGLSCKLFIPNWT